MTKKKINFIREQVGRIIKAEFGDHGSFGWNADHINPGVVELFDDKRLTMAEKLLAVEMLMAQFKAKLLSEILET